MVERRYNGFSLLDLSIQTGRTHQIRVHLSSMHHPIVGDTLYGSSKRLAQVKHQMIRAGCSTLQRPFLHARLIGFKHPRTDVYHEFESPLPRDLQELLNMIESEACYS